MSCFLCSPYHKVGTSFDPVENNICIVEFMKINYRKIRYKSDENEKKTQSNNKGLIITFFFG